MKKGEARKQAILDTAESMFFDRGYENTSVQDILDEMHLSKGGFYHHFQSKLQLLENICAQRAQMSCERGVSAVASVGDDPIDQFNALFQHGGFFGEESIKYLALMLSAAYSGEFGQLREQIRVTMLRQFEPILENILMRGVDQEIFYLKHPKSLARMLIMLACDVTDDVAYAVAQPTGDAAQFGEVLELLNVYENSVELILNAPYGSIHLLDIKRIAQLLRSLVILSGQPAPYEDWNQFLS